MTASIVAPAPAEENLIGAKELGTRLGLSYWTVQDWSRAGKIPCVRISSRTIRFRLSEVARHLGLRVEEGDSK